MALVKIKYPKLVLLTVSIFLAYALFQANFFEKIALTLNSHGYASMFLGGALFAFGFTAAFAVAMFIELSNTVNPLIGALIAGFGALISDFLIFRFIRLSFQDEFEKLNTVGIFGILLLARIAT